MSAPYNKIVLGNETLIDLTDATLSQTGTDAQKAAYAAKILAGETAYGNDGRKITGTCTFDVDSTDATATKSEILATKTAYVNGQKLTGEMVNHENANIELDGATEAPIPIGFYDGSGKVVLSADELAVLKKENIKEGVTILGVEGEFAGEEVAVTPPAQEAYTTQQVYDPADFGPVEGKTPTVFTNFTVKAIAKEEVSNTRVQGS